MADKPSFYSILTADVRYDERLSFFARVLYSDITAMCNVKGYCSAGNEHFADKFKQSKRTVSGTIARLAELGYLRVEVIRDVGKTVVERRIWVQANAQEAMEKVAHAMVLEQYEGRCVAGAAQALQSVPPIVRQMLTQLKLVCAYEGGGS